jgi:hypothetical protein
MRYDERPADNTPVHTADLPATPIRDRNIPATAWIEAPAELLHLGADLADDPADSPIAEYKRRIGPWLLWRAGPATDGDARYWACHGEDFSCQVTFRLYPDGSGDGLGADGSSCTRFRAWKATLLGRGSAPGASGGPRRPRPGYRRVTLAS